MKIIQIIPNFDLAGAEIMCENLIYELKKLGEDVIAVSLYNFHSAITKRLEANNIRIVFLNKKRGLDFSIFFKLYKLFKKEKPDVIHTHLYSIKYVIPAAMLAKVKCKVHTIHNIAQKESGKLDRQLNKFFYKYIGVIPVALSNKIKETIIEEYNLRPDKVPVIFNGINLNKCIAKSNYKLNDKIKIIHIGRFSKQKNHLGIIQAFEQFHKNNENSELRLIGVGEEKEKIEKIVDQKHLNSAVFFLGQQSDIYSYLNDADIFLFPSLWEGIPMTIIEAMGTGLPIIASNVGGIPDMLINNEEALIVSNNIEEIVEALDKITRDENLRTKLGENAKSKSKIFSSYYMQKKYMEIYKSVL